MGKREGEKKDKKQSGREALQEAKESIYIVNYLLFSYAQALQIYTAATAAEDTTAHITVMCTTC